MMACPVPALLSLQNEFDAVSSTAARTFSALMADDYVMCSAERSAALP